MTPEEKLMRLLLDDCPFRDITTRGLGIGRVPRRVYAQAQGRHQAPGREGDRGARCLTDA